MGQLASPGIPALSPPAALALTHGGGLDPRFGTEEQRAGVLESGSRGFQVHGTAVVQGPGVGGTETDQCTCMILGQFAQALDRRLGSTHAHQVVQRHGLDTALSELSRNVCRRHRFDGAVGVTSAGGHPGGGPGHHGPEEPTGLRALAGQGP